jgi:phenylpropionate dioxygenase-like ring-hydroxylating dioxygenase large terminal subunit
MADIDAGALSRAMTELKWSTARRLIGHLRAGTSDRAKAPMRQPVRAYTDPARFAAEKELLFGNTPLMVCFSSDVAEPGAVRLFDETGVPIVVTRAKDGTLNAFLNICPHRGARLVRDCEPKARLTCWFHAWTFDLHGKRIGTPLKDEFEGVLDGARDLTRVPVAERHGLVWVLPNPEGTLDIDAFLGDFGPELAKFEFGRAVPIKRGELPVASNWKYALDTYGECYHFKSLHAASLGPYFRHDTQVYDRFGPHHRITFASTEHDRWVNLPEAEWDVEHFIGYINYIYPNTIIFTGAVEPGKGYYTCFRLFPGAEPGLTVTQKAIYAPRGVHSEDYRASVEAAYDATAHVVMAEDYTISAESYVGLKRLGPDATLLFGRNEVALQNYHKAINAALGERG